VLQVVATMATDSKNGDAATLSLGSQDSLNYRLQVSYRILWPP
jgi:hypothetical protein